MRILLIIAITFISLNSFGLAYRDSTRSFCNNELQQITRLVTREVSKRDAPMTDETQERIELLFERIMVTFVPKESSESTKKRFNIKRENTELDNFRYEALTQFALLYEAYPFIGDEFIGQLVAVSKHDFYADNRRKALSILHYFDAPSFQKAARFMEQNDGIIKFLGSSSGQFKYQGGKMAEKNQELAKELLAGDIKRTGFDSFVHYWSSTTYEKDSWTQKAPTQSRR